SALLGNLRAPRPGAGRIRARRLARQRGPASEVATPGWRAASRSMGFGPAALSDRSRAASDKRAPRTLRGSSGAGLSLQHDSLTVSDQRILYFATITQRALWYTAKDGWPPPIPRLCLRREFLAQGAGQGPAGRAAADA